VSIKNVYFYFKDYILIYFDNKRISLTILIKKKIFTAKKNAMPPIIIAYYHSLSTHACKRFENCF